MYLIRNEMDIFVIKMQSFVRVNSDYFKRFILTCDFQMYFIIYISIHYSMLKICIKKSNICIENDINNTLPYHKKLNPN